MPPLPAPEGIDTLRTVLEAAFVNAAALYHLTVADQYDHGGYGHAGDVLTLRRHYRRAMYAALDGPHLPDDLLLTLLVLTRDACIIGIYGLVETDEAPTQYHLHRDLVDRLHAARTGDAAARSLRRRLLRMLDTSLEGIALYVRLPRGGRERSVAAGTDDQPLEKILNLRGTVRAGTLCPLGVELATAVQDRTCTSDADIVRVVGRWLRRHGYGEREYLAAQVNRKRTQLMAVDDGLTHPFARHASITSKGKPRPT